MRRAALKEKTIRDAYQIIQKRLRKTTPYDKAIYNYCTTMFVALTCCCICTLFRMNNDAIENATHHLQSENLTEYVTVHDLKNEDRICVERAAQHLHLVINPSTKLCDLIKFFKNAAEFRMNLFQGPPSQKMVLAEEKLGSSLHPVMPATTQW